MRQFLGKSKRFFLMPPRSKKAFSKGIPEALLQWGLISVSIALAPMVFTYVGILLTGKSVEPGLNGFVRAVSSRGELLIIAVALLGEGLSDMLKRSSSQNLKLALGGFGCFLPLVLSCLFYAQIQSSTVPLDPGIILLLSKMAIGWAICVGAACKFLLK
jgi:hypothetical protein